jgi:hypothetical protein
MISNLVYCRPMCNDHPCITVMNALLHNDMSADAFLAKDLLSLLRRRSRLAMLLQ